MRFKLTVLPGDGVGPEVAREAVHILQAVCHFFDCEFVCEEKAIGGAAIRAYGTPLPESARSWTRTRFDSRLWTV